MDSCLGARGLFGHSSSSDAAFGSRQLEVIQDLDLYFIRQIARGLGVSRSGQVRRRLVGPFSWTPFLACERSLPPGSAVRLGGRVRATLETRANAPVSIPSLEMSAVTRIVVQRALPSGSLRPPRRNHPHHADQSARLPRRLPSACPECFGRFQHSQVDAFASDETVRRKLTGELARELRRERFQAVPTGPAGPNRHGVFVISGARR